jgi:tRNA-specific 2-thiouridylase
VLDYESRFRESVIDDFADAYVRGETPIPCVRCNQTVKFRDLLSTAHDLGADALATGHYVKRVAGPAGAELHRAADHGRDQSYFLFATTQAQLDFLRFPLGGMPKTETREAAARFDLPVADKPDSQDICFVPNGSYAQIVEKLRPEAVVPGDIVDTDGRVVGRHEGIIHYTVGQRRGLGIGGRDPESDPLYVIRLEAASHRVVVGPKAALGRDRLRLSSLNWLGGDLPADAGSGLAVKIRSAMEPVPATVVRSPDGGAEVVFRDRQFGVSPGQACVIYDGDRVLGGGWIEREPAAIAA